MFSCSSSSSMEWETDEEATSSASPSLYTILGVDITASPTSIKSAYRRLARLWHPDRHRGNLESVRRFQQIQHAYEVLSDDQRRKEYDLGLLEQLDVEEYLSRFQGFILTVCGLGMSSRRSSFALQEEHGRPMQPLLTAA